MDIEKRGLNGNYELISQGPFKVTMFYGFTGEYKPRILGYYRHSPGTYQDLEMVDLVNTHSYDYIDGEAKLQYQLDGRDTWYDSNFDYRDGYTAPFTTMTDRLGDDVYNIQHVMDKYGNRMTKARGLTWEINEQTNHHHHPVRPRRNDRAGTSKNWPGCLPKERGYRRLAHRAIRQLCRI